MPLFSHVCFPGTIQNMLRLKCAECLYIYIYAYIHTYMYAHTYMHIHIYICMHTATRKLFDQEKLIIKILMEVSGK